MIYPLDRVIHSLNNWGKVYKEVGGAGQGGGGGSKESLLGVFLERAEL